jgi:hypothetical protein
MPGFLSRHTVLRRPFALRILPPGRGRAPFQRENQASACDSHRGLVGICPETEKPARSVSEKRNQDGRAGLISIMRNPVGPRVCVRSGAKTGTGTRFAALRRQPVRIFTGFCDVPSRLVIRFEAGRNRLARSDTGIPGSRGNTSPFFRLDPARFAVQKNCGADSGSRHPDLCCSGISFMFR